MYYLFIIMQAIIFFVSFINHVLEFSTKNNGYWNLIKEGNSSVILLEWNYNFKGKNR
jgi:hypothetical protein